MQQFCWHKELHTVRSELGVITLSASSSFLALERAMSNRNMTQDPVVSQHLIALRYCNRPVEGIGLDLQYRTSRR